jgi:hypothetical protein
MTLYYVHTNGPDGENMDMFVNADSPSEAGQLMVDYWAGEGVELYRDEPIMAVVVPAAGPKGIVTWGQPRRALPPGSSLHVGGHRGIAAI